MPLLPEGHPHKVCKDFSGTLVVQKHSDVKMEVRPNGKVVMVCFSQNLVLEIALSRAERRAVIEKLKPEPLYLYDPSQSEPDDAETWAKRCGFASHAELAEAIGNQEMADG